MATPTTPMDANRGPTSTPQIWRMNMPATITVMKRVALWPRLRI